MASWGRVTQQLRDTRKNKQSNAGSSFFPNKMIAKIRMVTEYHTTKDRTITEYQSTTNQQQQNHRIRTDSSQNHWGISYKPNFYVSGSTSELRVRLARRETGLSPPVKYFYWPFLGGASFGNHLCNFCVAFLTLSCVSVYWCFLVTCWERADLLALVCDVLLWSCHFPIGICILGQVWCLIVSVPWSLSSFLL